MGWYCLNNANPTMTIACAVDPDDNPARSNAWWSGFLDHLRHCTRSAAIMAESFEDAALLRRYRKCIEDALAERETLR